VARTLEQEKRRLKWTMIAPAVAFIGLMVVFPLAYTAWLSLTDAFGAVNADTRFLGLTNYADALGDTRRFWPAVGRTAVFTVGAVALELVLGLALAMLLRRPFRGMRWMRWMRTILMIPLLATPVAVGVVWLLILDPTVGIANALLGLVGIPPQPFLGSAAQSLPTLILIDVWQWTPFVMLALFAGLQSLPVAPYRAAAVDGASPLQTFRRLTLPLLMPLMAVIVLLRLIDAFKIFDTIFILTGGGPGQATESLSLFTYKTVFDFWNLGTATATAVVIWIMFFVFSNVFYQVARRTLRAF
jgi:multiple sugar transport system permease protein